MASTPTGPAAEIATLEGLTQQTAAWMLGVTPRSLRDHPEIRRNADGSYDARELIAFARSQGQLPRLTDEQFETALQIADRVPPEVVALIRPAVNQLVREIGGDEAAALAAIGAVLWQDRVEMVATFPEQFTHGPKRFSRVFVCDTCKRYRMGRRWVKGSPPDDLVEIGHTCPQCLSGLGRFREPIDPDDLDAELDPSERKPTRKGAAAAHRRKSNR